MKQICRYALWAFIISILLSGTASAEDRTAWGSVQGETAVFYLPGAQGEEVFSCQIGNVAADIQAVASLRELEFPVETVILIDNSLSIQKSQRSVIKELLSDLIANRLPGERYTMATISDRVDYLCTGESDYGRLKAVVDNLSFQDQHTQLTDGLYHVLDCLRNSDEGILRRLVIIADGVDNKQIGYTQSELAALIQETGYPIYTVGCSNSSASATEELQNLFALSRLTPGDSYYLPEIEGTMDIVSGVISWNESAQITVKLPPEVCDGMEKALRITENADGSVYMLRLRMPLAELQEPTKEPDPVASTIPVQESDPEIVPEPTNHFPWPIVLILVLILAAMTAIIVFWRKKRNADRIEEAPEVNPPRDLPGPTIFLPDSDRRDPPTGDIWDKHGKIRLIFQNLDVPSHRLEIPLTSEVLVGRDASVCQVVLTEPSVARRQCRIFRQGSWVLLSNLSQSNKTKLNGRTLAEDCELMSGSTLQMGRLRMRVDIIEDAGEGEYY